eukprot:PhM_4_TR13522/c0_g1_i1/m.30774
MVALDTSALSSAMSAASSASSKESKQQKLCAAQGKQLAQMVKPFEGITRRVTAIDQSLQKSAKDTHLLATRLQSVQQQLVRVGAVEAATGLGADIPLPK